MTALLMKSLAPLSLIRSRLLSGALVLGCLLFCSFAPGAHAQTPVIQIDAGGGAVAPFIADTDFSAGNEFSSTATISTSGVTNPAPAAVYQSVRWNASFNYTIPSLTAGASYLVRLHFVELSFTASGDRVFNVAINGTSVLSNFDIFAQVGENHALVEQFNATANSSGQIVIAFTQGSADNPSIAGIEVDTPASVPAVPTGVTATAGVVKVTLGWSASSGAASYNVYRGTSSGGESSYATGITTTSYTDTGVTAGTAYYYKIAAVNSAGTSAESSEVSATPTSGVTVPPTPTGVTATAGVVQVALGWSASSGATSYNVYRGTSSGGESSYATGITTTSYTDTGVTAGTAYYYKVAAVNSAGTSAESAEVNATPTSSGGSLPPNTAVLQIDAGGGAVAPFVADEDFSAGTEFSSTATINTSGVTNAAPAAVYQTVRWNASFNYTLPGLTAGASYVVRLHFVELSFTASGQRVFNVAINGTSVLSNFDIFAQVGENHALVEQFNATANSSGQIVVAFTQGSADNPSIAGLEVWTPPSASVPPTPTGVTATAGVVKVTLGWSASSGATSYNVYRGTSAGGESSYATGITTTSYTDTGVAAGTAYYYKVAAVNSVGTSAESSEVSATPTSGVTIPPTPTGVTATAGVVKVTLGWTASSGATSYNVYRGTSAGGESSYATGITTTSYTDTSVTAGTAYYYKVAAVNSAGTSAESSEVSATPTSGVPPTPTGVTATAGVVQVALGWSASSGATSYSVYRSTSSGGEGTTAYASGLSSTSYTDTSVTAGTTYYYKVAAVNSAGTSAQSSEVSATPTPAGTTTVLQINAGGGAVSPFVADEYYSAGSEFSSTATINTSGQTNAAPAAVYQTVRWNASFNYTLPGLTAGASYIVRLHFVELSFTASGDRVFNVAINGTSVLSNFDIYAKVGENHALVEQFTATANSSGQIVIAFTQGSADNPSIAGIEALSASTYPLTVSNGTGSGSYVAGTAVAIAASAPPAGEVFAGWTGGTAANFANASSSSTTYTTTAAAQTITATYATAPTYALTVSSGSGSGSYAAGTAVTITANAPPTGEVFTGWTGGTAGNFANASSATTTYTTAAAAQTITATYGTAAPPTTVGANTPFVSYEAEAGTLGGGATVVALTSPPTTEFSSPQLEASGHAYVHLGATGQNVLWTNNTGKTITTLNIRYSIPDSSGGGGITSTLDLYVNGTLVSAVPVNSTQTWVYETSSSYNGMSQVPTAGSPHVFWDEVGLFVPGGIPAGGSFTLQKDSANSASYYNIDVVDLESPTELPQPANSISVMSYGAQPNNPSFDNSTALQNCFNAAASANEIAWIPPGTYYISSGGALEPANVTIQGAGPWYSSIVCTKTNWANGFMIHGNSASFLDLCLDATLPDSTPGMYAILANGSNWTINNVWARHTMLVWGSGTTATIENSRVNNSWGDGMNLNNVVGQTCSNILIYNNFSRGNGDDAIALDSSSTSEPPVQYVTVKNNTTVASWWANQMGVYGGENIMIEDNLLKDSVKKQGLELNAGFGALPPQNVTAQFNTILRGGSYGYAIDEPGMIIEGDGTNMTVNDNTITDSMFEAVQVSTGTNNLQFQDNLITAPGTTGIIIPSGTTGTGTFLNNMVESLNSGQSAYINDAASTFTATVTANNWQGGPAAPASLTPSVLSSSAIQVDWSGVTGATSYDLLRANVSHGPYQLIDSGLTGGTATDAGLAASTTYYYVITAVNSSGVSVYSPEVSATTSP
jgi:fibronectin type 3 domain-containing protein